MIWVVHHDIFVFDHCVVGPVNKPNISYQLENIKNSGIKL